MFSWSLFLNLEHFLGEFPTTILYFYFFTNKKKHLTYKDKTDITWTTQQKRRLEMASLLDLPLLVLQREKRGGELEEQLEGQRRTGCKFPTKFLRFRSFHNLFPSSALQLILFLSFHTTHMHTTLH